MLSGATLFVLGHFTTRGSIAAGAVLPSPALRGAELRGADHLCVVRKKCQAELRLVGQKSLICDKEIQEEKEHQWKSRKQRNMC